MNKAAGNEETLYELAQRAYEIEQERYEWAEEKTERYLTVLAVVLAATAIGVPDVARLLAGPLGGLHIAFFGAGAVVVSAAVFSLYHSLRAVRVETVPFLPLDGSLRKFFRTNAAAEALPAMTDRFFDGAGRLRAQNDARMRSVELAGKGIKVVLVAAVVTLGLFFSVKVQEAIMANPKQGSQQTQRPGPGTTRPTTSRPTAPDFVPVKKGEDPKSLEKR